MLYSSRFLVPGNILPDVFFLYPEISVAPLTLPHPVFASFYYFMAFFFLNTSQTTEFSLSLSPALVQAAIFSHLMCCLFLPVGLSTSSLTVYNLYPAPHES